MKTINKALSISWGILSKISSKLSSKLSSKSYIIISNTTLIVWGIFLIFIGTQAVNKKAAHIILRFADFDNLIMSINSNVEYTADKLTKGKSKSCKNVDEELNRYMTDNYGLIDKYSIPPVALVLNQLYRKEKVDWRDPSEIDKINGDTKAPTCNDYNILFDRVDQHLNAIIIENSKKTNGQSTNITGIDPQILFPKFLKQGHNPSLIPFDLEVKLWIDKRILQDKPPQESNNSGDNNCQTVSHVTNELNKYINIKYKGIDKNLIPPIATVLDRLQINVNWRNAKQIQNSQKPNEKQKTNEEQKPNEEQNITCSDYYILFDIVAERLTVIPRSHDLISTDQSLTIDNNILPPIFRHEGFKEQKIPLPLEAVLWVKNIQSQHQETQEAISLVSLFVLLIILGAFGSWVYLVRLHILGEKPLRLEEYFYRPILGMALALAVFIINLSFHSLLSNSEMNKVRYETLTVLAFAAGFLSEKTYLAIEKITEQASKKQQ